MVACEDVYLKDSRKEDYVKELIENINIIKNHPSLAIVCGNNEGEDKLKDRQENIDAVIDYIELFEIEFKKIMEKLDNQLFYWPSSPSNIGSFIKTNDPSYGDSHLWGVWFANKPFDYYNGMNVRFASEYGYESIPYISTVNSFSDINSESFLNQLSIRERTGVFNGIDKILFDIKERYGDISTNQGLIYASQLLQAEMFINAIEYFRSIRGICMGSIYWQLNDCWPCVSHSTIDYFLRKKIATYAIRKLYSPFLIILNNSSDEIKIKIVNERRECFKGKLHFKISDNFFNVIFEKIIDININSLSVKDIDSIICSKKINKKEVFVTAELLDDDNNVVSKNTILFVKPKEYLYEIDNISYELRRLNKDDCLLSIQSNCFIYKLFINIDVDLDNNLIDITSYEPVVIKFKYTKDLSLLEKNISFDSLNKIRGH